VIELNRTRQEAFRVDLDSRESTVGLWVFDPIDLDHRRGEEGVLVLLGFGSLLLDCCNSQERALFPTTIMIMTIESRLLELVAAQVEDESHFRYDDDDYDGYDASDPTARWLQQYKQQQQVDRRHRVLFALYFCLLICCCITPFLYYLRLYLWQRSRLRQLRELEHAGLMAILQQTMLNNNNNNNERGRGVDGEALTMVQQERKARIKQMMEPVRKVRQEATASCLFITGAAGLFVLCSVCLCVCTKAAALFGSCCLVLTVDSIDIAIVQTNK
jgi:hypothetical protein